MITDIVTCVEAFTVYMWIICCPYPSRWQDMTQCKLLILQTTCQFSGKAWLHYDTAFRKDTAASGLTNWSRMNSDLYNFHTRYPLATTTTVPASYNFILAFKIDCLFIFFSADPGIMAPVPGPMVNVGMVTAVRIVKEHPRVNRPFRASMSCAQPSGSSTPPWSKCQRC